MAPKVRKSQKHLPPNMYLKCGSYYYVFNEGNKRRWVKLGRTLSEAMKKWIDIANTPVHVTTMNHLFDRYMIEVAPLKSKASYKANLSNIQTLRFAFGNMEPGQVSAVDIYRFMDERGKTAKVAANREKALLSHVFSMGIRWGVVFDNPCRHVKRITEKPRQRYIEDEEYIAVKSIAPELIKNLMDFGYLTGQRIGDILSIKKSDISDQGIKIEQNKTGKKIIIQWTEELTKLVDRINSMSRGVLTGMSLFKGRRGQQLTYDGFKTVWQKVMKQALADGLIKESFHFHDIRAKSSSDASSRQQASELLGHTDSRITERVYNRKAKVVRPIR